MTGFRFLRIRGIPVEAHWSSLLMLAFLLQVVIGRLGRPEIDTPTMMAMAISCAALFFLSILLHELGHALWALREQWQAEKITLFAMGGIAWLRPNGPYFSARSSFRIVAAGPLVTLALVLLFGAVARAGEALGWPGPVVDVAGLLALANLIILLFNLAPALPLDGGQMLRARLWRRPGGPEAAERTLVITGALSAYLALGGGIALLLTGTLYAGFVAAIAGGQILFVRWIYDRTAASARVNTARRAVVGDLLRRRAAPAQGDGSTLHAAAPDGEEVRLDANISLEDALEQLPNPADRGMVVEDGRVTGIVSRPVIAEALLEAANAERERRRERAALSADRA